MIRIGIVDDDILHSTKLENYILNYTNEYDKVKVEVDFFKSGTSFLKCLNTGNESYQILFLDIEMEAINGIETAREIRKTDKNMTIIYVTSYDQYTMESFKVAPFRYLLKPITEEQIKEVLIEAIEEIKLNNKYLFVKHQNNQYQLKIEHIISISSESGRLLRIVTEDSDEEYHCYGKIKEIEKLLKPSLFVKVNQGSIINLSFIHIISDSNIHLTNSEIFSISRGQKKIVKEAYHNFIKRSIGL